MHAIFGSFVFTVAMLAAGSACAQSDASLIGQGDWNGPLAIRFTGALHANHPLHVVLPADGCFQSGSHTIDATRSVVSRNGADVRIDLYAHGPLCFSAGDPLTVWIHHEPLGTFEPGNYTLTARYHYIGIPDASPYATLTTPMSVAGGAGPVTLDSRRPWSLALLVLVLAAAGVGAQRLRKG